MSDRARIALILGGIGLVAGGAGYYYFKVWRPAQDLENAQDEIAGWEKRFQGVRDCLLGKTPGSSKTSEALAIREMAPDPWDRGRCTPLISKLNRGEAPDTGIRAIEDAWINLDKAASKAALAFARHVSESTTLEIDPLPDALDNLDTARQALRASAKMAAAPIAGKPLTAAQVLPLKDGEHNLLNLIVDTIPSAHGLILFGHKAPLEKQSPLDLKPLGPVDVQVKLTAGGPPEVRSVAERGYRAVPDMSWGVVAGDSAVGVGAVDAAGAIAAPTTFAAAPTSAPKRAADDELPPTPPTVAAVTGTLNDGVVVFGTPTDLTIVTSKAGAFTAGTPTKITAAQASIDVDGRIALLTSDDSKAFGVVLQPGVQTAPPVELPTGQLGEACMTADRVWTQTFETAIAFGGGRPTLTKPMRERLQGCTSEAALFHAPAHPDTLVICTDDCRTVKIPSSAPQFATTTVVGGKLVAIASHSGVLGVWREGQPVAFYALSEGATPVLAHEWPAMALTDGKVIDILARGEKTFVLIRIPAN